MAQPVHSPKSFMELSSSGVAEPLLAGPVESRIGMDAGVVRAWGLMRSPTRTMAATDGIGPFGDFLLTKSM